MRFARRGNLPTTLRAQALSKLAQFTANSNPNEIDNVEHDKHQTLDFITHTLPCYYAQNKAKLYAIPVTLNEWEIFLSLCYSNSNNFERSNSILQDILFPYLLSAPQQMFTERLQNHLKNNDLRNANEIFTFSLMNAVINHCHNFPQSLQECYTQIDKYLELILNSYTEKFSVIFSLMGFINAFIKNNSCFELNKYVWSKLSKLFYSYDFLQNLEQILSFSPNLTNDAVVLYHQMGHELAVAMFLNLMSQLSRSLCTSILLQVNPNDSESSSLQKTHLDQVAEKYRKGKIPKYLLQLKAEDYKRLQKLDLEQLSEDIITPDSHEKLIKNDEYKHIEKAVSLNTDFLVEIFKFSFEMFSTIDKTVASTENSISFLFYAKSHFLESLSIIPFVLPVDDKWFSQLSDTIGDFITRYLLSELTPHVFIKTIISTASLLNFYSSDNSLSLLNSFPIIISSHHLSKSLVEDISDSFTKGLFPLNEDAVVKTIYSINNQLVASRGPSHAVMMKKRNLAMQSMNDRNGYQETVTSDMESTLNRSFSQLELNGTTTPDSYSPEDNTNVFSNCVKAAINIASSYDETSITALTIAILTQKVKMVSKELDKIIISSLTKVARFASANEFAILLKFYKTIFTRYSIEKNTDFLNAVSDAMTKISSILLLKKYKTDIYFMQLHSLLEGIVACGDIEKPEHHRSSTEITLVAESIGFYLPPLTALLPKLGTESLNWNTNETTVRLFRDVWFNLAVHGFSYGSERVKKHYSSLLTIAYNSPPLASEFPRNNKEMPLEMNSILRRSSSTTTIKEQKKAISDFYSMSGVQPRTTSDAKIMFIAATVLLEKIRCEAGDCSKVILYFTDSAVATSSLQKSLELVNQYVIKKYCKFVQAGSSKIFNFQNAVKQLKNMFYSLIHRDLYVQNIAFTSCDIFIRRLPSTLCHQDSLYTFLDIMTAVFDSIVDYEKNRFQPRYKFTLKHSKKDLLFPDTITWRNATITGLRNTGEEWLKLALDKSNQDIKILLQSYIFSSETYNRFSNVEYGISFAMDMAGSIIPADKELSKLAYSGATRPNTIADFIHQNSWKSKYLVDKVVAYSEKDMMTEIVENLDIIQNRLDSHEEIPENILFEFLNLSAGLVIWGKNSVGSLIHHIVRIPFELFTPEAISSAINIWLTIIKERPDMAHILLVEIGFYWMRSIDKGLGLFSRNFDPAPEEFQIMEYKPYDKPKINQEAHIAMRSFQPHRFITKFFSSHFEGTLYQSDALLKLFTSWTLKAVENFETASLHIFSRLIRNEILNFAMMILNANIREKTKQVKLLSQAITNSGLSWFMRPISWPFGADNMHIKTDLSVINDLYTSLNKESKLLTQYGGKEFNLLQAFIYTEIIHIQVWLDFSSETEGKKNSVFSSDLISVAFKKHPQFATNIIGRTGQFQNDVISLIVKNPLDCIGVADALPLYLSGVKGKKGVKEFYPVLYWTPVSPLSSINLFLPQWKNNNIILQYAVLSLESHDVHVTFFYVPQIVQCLRYDETGYVERLILDTASIDMLFSHQIIWNMLANCYRGDEALEEDPMKPTLDRVRERMVSEFSGFHKEFYEREFGFFDEVTGISGKLKPYIKKSKAEKKQKIDEEMAKIVVKKDVYLPSNPDGVVVDINRKSGKPLQSHAKAPFMATFKIRKEETNSATGETNTVEKWQSAIFKVGDDCRQDVLALQLISMFRTIWSSIGLDVYVFPYRVTATSPGCGVIDVLPNSISRDMLGREAVNGLYEYFISKFGNEDTIEFQNARNNFVKSLAGYSVISYLLQFKDRHNGNIMYDDQGHCLHIDFGFIFDIVPGGVKFEAVPFKLTKEMVSVMGGSPNTIAYKDFEELCIKAYLAARPHMEALIGCVEPMMGSELPCFKGSKTIRNLRNRFQPQKTNHEAAMFMKSLIKRSFESYFTKGYDEFQRLTNGIPY